MLRLLPQLFLDVDASTPEMLIVQQGGDEKTRELQSLLTEDTYPYHLDTEASEVTLQFGELGVESQRQ